MGYPDSTGRFGMLEALARGFGITLSELFATDAEAA
jgi:hypothetical protein